MTQPSPPSGGRPLSPRGPGSDAPELPKSGGKPRRRDNRGVLVATLLAVLFVVGTAGLSNRFEHRDTTASGSPKPSGAFASAGRPNSGDRDPSTKRTPSAPQEVVTLVNNPLDSPGIGATPTPCSLPPFATSVAGQDAFYHAVLPCLVRLWSGALRDSDLPLQVPSVVTTGSDINTPCGVQRWNDTALYCPDNNTIYMTARHYAEVEGRTSPGAYLGQFAHEFGHAVQHMTGIFEAKDDALRDTGRDTTAGLDVTRRTELQATCFEGIALAALQQGGINNNYILGALQDSEQRGDEYNPQPNHGTVAINKTWVDRGFFSDRVTQCNTWAAPPAAVS
jgi:predicted metalloprotease